MIERLKREIGFIYLQRTGGLTPPTTEPTMDPEGISRFKFELGRAKSYLEFGSGGTTLLADRKRISTVSVESDRFYAAKVASKLCGDTVEQLVVNLGINLEWGYPLRHTPKKGKKYASAPFLTDYKIADFILVDGRYRVACALESAKRAYDEGRQATLMFDDYSPRPEYHQIEAHLGSPEINGRSAIFRIGLKDIPISAIEAAYDDYR